MHLELKFELVLAPRERLDLCFRLRAGREQIAASVYQQLGLRISDGSNKLPCPFRSAIRS